MSCKHVDLIAVGALLLAMALFLHVRGVATQPHGIPRRIVFPQPRVIRIPHLPPLVLDRG
jgi:hypothetical protein